MIPLLSLRATSQLIVTYPQWTAQRESPQRVSSRVYRSGDCDAPTCKRKRRSRALTFDPATSRSVFRGFSCSGSCSGAIIMRDWWYCQYIRDIFYSDVNCNKTSLNRDRYAKSISTSLIPILKRYAQMDTIKCCSNLRRERMQRAHIFSLRCSI